MAGYRTVVVGTDGSETSYRAVERAAVLAQDAHAALVIACAYAPEKPDPAAQDVLKDEGYQVVGSAPAEDSLGRARDHAVGAGAVDVAIDTRALPGKAAESLIALVGELGADLLVVGNRGLNTLAGRLIGSVPQDVVRHSPVDVLVVHTT
ncbi:universal stress protein [uncultured Jatrophihabitans sp.]|uniref:universal stress protein n=1 Tax=uncultured Jatrophihabitans sp. TaxID=1610747 RepID=UPI0035C9F37C